MLGDLHSNATFSQSLELGTLEGPFLVNEPITTKQPHIIPLAMHDNLKPAPSLHWITL